MLRLHLGCGEVKLEGFVNIDIRFLSTVDIVDNVMFLKKYKMSSVDLIYASHILEHFYRWKSLLVLQRWHSLLKPDGILRMAVPNFAAICDHYQKNKNLKALSGLLYGGQDIKENFHYACWDFETLDKDLSFVGFKKVYRFDWRKTEHAHVDDCSQAYLPHMDKENGMLMSLNVEAKK